MRVFNVLIRELVKSSGAVSEEQFFRILHDEDNKTPLARLSAWCERKNRTCSEEVAS
jgi:hypothetical protein